MSPNDLQGCVESLPTQANERIVEKVSLLQGKEIDDGHTKKTGLLGGHDISGYNIGLRAPLI